MFCSLTVEPKGAGNCDRAPPPAQLAQVIRTATSEWARARTPTPRHVGGSPKRKWTPAEDALLVAALAELGSPAWAQIALRVPGRTGKQCRERWLGRLASGVGARRGRGAHPAAGGARERVGAHPRVPPARSIGAINNRWNWLARRDVPNHADEFRAIAEAHGRTDAAPPARPRARPGRPTSGASSTSRCGATPAPRSRARF
jgi:hypothetical protein